MMKCVMFLNSAKTVSEYKDENPTDTMTMPQDITAENHMNEDIQREKTVTPTDLALGV
jgi:hypothetical protein